MWFQPIEQFYAQLDFDILGVRLIIFVKKLSASMNVRESMGKKFIRQKVTKIALVDP